MSYIVLGLLCLLQAWPSSTQFVLEFELVSVATIDSEICDHVPQEQVEALGACEPFLSTFCLREGTSTQNNDTRYCPLGRNDTGIVAYTPGVDLDEQPEAATKPGLPNGPLNLTITSQHPWPRTFQLYIEARELDPCCFMGTENIHLDGIFINEILEVNAGFTPTETYSGTNAINRVVLGMRLRVMCQQDYYGPDCTRLCRAQNDSVNGYYTCNSDGSIQCREGFRNISNNCTEAILACDSSPCTNDGSCTSMGAFHFTCQCAVGYTGSTCEVNIDDCVSATCPSNSMCVDGVHSFMCTCLPGFENSNDHSCVMVLQTKSQTAGPISVAIEVTIGVASSAALIIGILIIVIVVLSVLVIKGRKPLSHRDHQCTCQATDRDIETKPNEVYGLVSGQTGHRDWTTSIEMKPNEVYGFTT